MEPGVGFIYSTHARWRSFFFSFYCYLLLLTALIYRSQAPSRRRSLIVRRPASVTLRGDIRMRAFYFACKGDKAHDKAGVLSQVEVLLGQLQGRPPSRVDDTGT